MNVWYGLLQCSNLLELNRSTNKADHELATHNIGTLSWASVGIGGVTWVRASFLYTIWSHTPFCPVFIPLLLTLLISFFYFRTCQVAGQHIQIFKNTFWAMCNFIWFYIPDKQSVSITSSSWNIFTCKHFKLLSDSLLSNLNLLWETIVLECGYSISIVSLDIITGGWSTIFQRSEAALFMGNYSWQNWGVSLCAHDYNTAHVHQCLHSPSLSLCSYPQWL